ncbi:hypothetical protein D3C81_845100 [compost metagenome]
MGLGDEDLLEDELQVCLVEIGHLYVPSNVREKYTGQQDPSRAQSMLTCAVSE